MSSAWEKKYHREQLELATGRQWSPVPMFKELSETQLYRYIDQIRDDLRFQSRTSGAIAVVVFSLLALLVAGSLFIGPATVIPSSILLPFTAIGWYTHRVNYVHPHARALRSAEGAYSDRILQEAS